MDFVKSPLNYTGGKYKLLPQIVPLFPENINTFVDLFGGGFNVGINVEANRVIYNDFEDHVTQLLCYFNSNEAKDILNEIDKVIKEFGLSDTYRHGYEYYGVTSREGLSKVNREAYYKLRAYYNEHQENPLLFYCMIIFAFSNQIRFNKQGKFNMPVNKCDFNANMRNNLTKFVDEMHKRNVQFYSNDFRKVDLSMLTEDDIVYCDPPYLITCATYNEQDGWNMQDERDLLDLLDKLNDRGVKFALSNVFENKGLENVVLKEWSSKYNVHYLDSNYGNCNYHAKDKSKDTTIEVLITNY